MASQSVSSVRAWVLRSKVFQLGKHLLDGVEVRTVGRQIPQRSACPVNGRFHANHLVRAQVVHHHDVARAQLRHQKLLHPGDKCISIDRPVQHQGRQEARAAERADKRVVVCQCPPGA